MKREKKSKWPAVSGQKLSAFARFVNGNSDEAEQFRKEMRDIVEEEKKKWQDEIKSEHRMYEDIFGPDSDDDEDFYGTSF